jgi:nitrate/nitrite-specific signal transduction histidine kinase
VFGLLALVVAVALSLLLRENIAGPVQRLTQVADRIREGNLDVRAQVESNDEVGILAYTFNRMAGQLQETLRQVRQEKQRADDLLNVVIPIGVDLSAEQDFNRLLEKMLVEAQQFCRAEAGTLYLRDEDELQFVMVRNEVLDLNIGGAAGGDIPYEPLPLYDEAGQPNEQNVAAYVALHSVTLNLPDVYAPAQIQFTGSAVFDEQTGYKTASMLTIPLQNAEQRVLGVLQLINARHHETGEVVQFDRNLEQMMTSFSSLAAAALEAYIREQALRQEIRQLRIEIDEAKLQQQVSETVETDFFQDLQAKARDIRRRRRQAREQSET